MKEMVFDCRGDLSLSQQQTLAHGLGLVVTTLLSSQMRRKSEALTTHHKETSVVFFTRFMLLVPEVLEIIQV